MPRAPVIRSVKVELTSPLWRARGTLGTVGSASVSWSDDVRAPGASTGRGLGLSSTHGTDEKAEPNAVCPQHARLGSGSRPFPLPLTSLLLGSHSVNKGWGRDTGGTKTPGDRKEDQGLPNLSQPLLFYCCQFLTKVKKIDKAGHHWDAVLHMLGCPLLCPVH